MDELLSIEEAARRLGGVSTHTIVAWLPKGRLRRTKVGARTMIRESDLRTFIAACNAQTHAPNKAGNSNGGAQ